MCKIFIITIFILSSSLFADAQLVPDYLFLEVVDSNGKPVKDAVMQFKYNSFENDQSKEGFGKGRLTDEAGKLKTYYYHNSLSGISHSIFQVSKPEYFPFYDLGITVKRYQTNFKLELLKIPTNQNEQKILGNEQLKREFMWAVKKGDAEDVSKRIKSGISPNLNTNDLRGISDPKNVPAIIFAAANGDKKMIEVFIKAKVKLHQKDETIQNILHYYFAAPKFSNYQLKNENWQNELEEGVKYLVENGAQFKKLSFSRNANALMLSAQKGNLNLVKFFLSKKLSINAQDNLGQTVLFYAPRELFTFLLDLGADPNITAQYDKSICRSVLMGAVWAEDISLIRILLNHKADINFTCRDGNNALKIAKDKKDYKSTENVDEIIKLLIEAGAKE